MRRQRRDSRVSARGNLPAMQRYRVLYGDARDLVHTLPAGVAQAVVTSPPYYCLRDGIEDPDVAQSLIGLEPTPAEYIAAVMAVINGLQRVLRPSGLLFLNCGDSHATYAEGTTRTKGSAKPVQSGKAAKVSKMHRGAPYGSTFGIPGLFHQALLAGGWTVRQTVIWHKSNPVPESVKSRPVTSHEIVLIAARRSRPSAFWNYEAAQEPAANGGTRAVGSVWALPVQPYHPPAGAPYRSPMPLELASRCVRYGTRPGDLVLDPFLGAGTVALACEQLDRACIGIELDPRCEAHYRHRLQRQTNIWDAVHELRGAQ